MKDSSENCCCTAKLKQTVLIETTKENVGGKAVEILKKNDDGAITVQEFGKQNQFCVKISDLANPIVIGFNIQRDTDSKKLKRFPVANDAINVVDFC